MGLGIAMKAFSAALFNKETSERLRLALDGKTPPANLPEPKQSDRDSDRESGRDSDWDSAPAVNQKASTAQAPSRSDAITLLSALQREARLVDLIQEDLSNFSDAQVGAAARPCLQTCASTLTRLFGLAAVCDAGEGTTVDLSDAAKDSDSPARYQWIGEGSSTSGKLVHQGWQATQVDLPTWTGADADANVIAPAQLQR